MLEAEPDDAPHAVSPIQIAPATSMNFPGGILIVVPAFTINLEPSATRMSPLRFMVPDHVSVPVIVPEVVSFTADAAGNVTNPAKLESNNSITNDRLLCDDCIDKLSTS